MERITITVTEEQARRLRQEARRRHTTVSEVVRERIDRDPTIDPATGKRIIAFAAIGDSGGKAGTAAEMDEYLAEHWPDAIRRHQDP